MAKISVIIPCYNSASTIRETLESVLSQTYRDLETVVVDDGSTDQTKEIVLTMAPQIKYLYQENSGQSAARNEGIRAATGEFIAFVDSDDLWLPKKMEKQMHALTQHQADWCYCDCLYFRDTDQKILGVYSKLIYPPQQGWIAPSLILGNCLASPTPIVRRSLLEKTGLFDESPMIRSREDWELWLRIAVQAPVIYIPEALCKHRIHAGSITFAENPQKAFLSHVAVIEKNTALNPQVFMPLKEQALAYYAARFSKSHWLSGNVPAARELIHQAVGWQPRNLQYRLLQFVYGLPRWLLQSGLMLRNWLQGR
jgi:glycosyltransferase involved in cell wall biosynthesis